MGFFKKKIRQIENSEINQDTVNLVKATSDKAVDVIKELSGKDIEAKKKLIDNLIVFTNASGGTGASTIVSNVAYESIKKGLKVLVLDLNIMCPVQHTYLGIDQKLEKPDLVSYLLGETKLSDSIDVTNNINLLFANNRTLSDEINCNTKIAIENFEDMLRKLRSLYDLVIIDCPMRIDSMIHNVALYLADSIYTVWDEGISSVINTEKIRRNMALSGIDSFTKMRVVLNKRTSIHFSDYALNKLNIELVEVLPFTVDVIDNSLRGRIFCEKGVATSKNSADFARKVASLTDKVLKIGGYVEFKKE